MLRLYAFAITAVLALHASPSIAQQQIPNPAAKFCVDVGGTYRIVQEAGGARGLCVLADGRKVDAWAFFRESQGSSQSEAMK